MFWQEGRRKMQTAQKLGENIDAGNVYFDEKLQENALRKRSYILWYNLEDFSPHKIFFQDKTDNT